MTVPQARELRSACLSTKLRLPGEKSWPEESETIGIPAGAAVASVRRPLDFPDRR